jgi:hypothetical protein
LFLKCSFLFEISKKFLDILTYLKKKFALLIFLHVKTKSVIQRPKTTKNLFWTVAMGSNSYEKIHERSTVEKSPHLIVGERHHKLACMITAHLLDAACTIYPRCQHALSLQYWLLLLFTNKHSIYRKYIPILAPNLTVISHFLCSLALSLLNPGFVAMSSGNITDHGEKDKMSSLYNVMKGNTASGIS